MNEVMMHIGKVFAFRVPPGEEMPKVEAADYVLIFHQDAVSSCKVIIVAVHC